MVVPFIHSIFIVRNGISLLVFYIRFTKKAINVNSYQSKRYNHSVGELSGICWIYAYMNYSDVMISFSSLRCLGIVLKEAVSIEVNQISLGATM